MNSICIVGNATADFEIRRTNTGKSVCSFTLAVKRPRKSDTTDFIDCVVFEHGAEYLAKYGHKGSKVAVTGALTSRKWEDKNGNKRVSMEVLCEAVELSESRNSSGASTYSAPTPTTAHADSGDYSNTLAYINQLQGQKSDFAMLEDDDAQLPFE